VGKFGGCFAVMEERLLCVDKMIVFSGDSCLSVGLLDVIVRVGLVLATTFLFGIVVLAYMRMRSRKMLFILIGFGVFFFHAIIALPELVNEEYAIALSENWHLLLHLIGLIFILVGILQD
jgi:hypothetical protein